MTITIRVFSDFTCPFCYLGTGVVEQLKREYDVNAEWLGFELHPEVPESGILLAEKFPEYDLDALFEELRAKGARYGIAFSEPTFLSNTRRALEAAEFARDHGKHDAFQCAVFEAYFSLGRDIAQVDVILDLASRVGLDPDDLSKALNDGRCRARVDASRAEGLRSDVSVLPTFIFEGGKKIVGFRSIEAFRQVIKGLPHQQILDVV
ncbi:MAG: DsbA family protein [Syntrophobacteraceae bacterium]